LYTDFKQAKQETEDLENLVYIMDQGPQKQDPTRVTLPFWVYFFLVLRDVITQSDFDDLRMEQRQVQVSRLTSADIMSGHSMLNYLKFLKAQMISKNPGLEVHLQWSFGLTAFTRNEDLEDFNDASVSET
jgi:hypothetical protein